MRVEKMMENKEKKQKIEGHKKRKAQKDLFQQVLDKPWYLLNRSLYPRILFKQYSTRLMTNRNSNHLTLDLLRPM